MAQLVSSVRHGKRVFWSEARFKQCMRAWEGRRRYVPSGKYTVEQIKEMKRLYSLRLSQWEVADKYGCTQSLVSRIVRGVKYNRKGVTAFPRGQIALKTREIADGTAVNSRPKTILGNFPGIYARNQNLFLRSWPLGI